MIRRLLEEPDGSLRAWRKELKLFIVLLGVIILSITLIKILGETPSDREKPRLIKNEEVDLPTPIQDRDEH